ncbi:hypothetical protein SFRURICE_016237, partial [Spodoptera frugiperda]
AAERNSTLNNRHQIATLENQLTTATAVPETPRTNEPLIINERQILLHGERGTKGIRATALFMNTSSERLGIAFCEKRNNKWLTISPGLASLINGSTSRTSMRRKVYDALPDMKLLGRSCRLLRTRNKTIAMFSSVDSITGFAQACEVLSGVGEWGDVEGIHSRIISVDAAVVAYEKGKTVDLMGCIRASEHHEVIVYEDRGEDLSFLKRSVQRQPRVDSPSGSERLQQQYLQQSALQQQQRATERENKKLASRGRMWAITTAICSVTGLIASPFRKNASKSLKTSCPTQIQSAHSRSSPTRAAMGHVCPPKLRQATTPRDHLLNAFHEFIAVIEATKQVNLQNCEAILQTYLQGNELILDDRLEAAEAVIYNNTLRVLRGTSIS